MATSKLVLLGIAVFVTLIIVLVFLSMRSDSEDRRRLIDEGCRLVDEATPVNRQLWECPDGRRITR